MVLTADDIDQLIQRILGSTRPPNLKTRLELQPSKVAPFWRLLAEPATATTIRLLGLDSAAWDGVWSWAAFFFQWGPHLSIANTDEAFLAWAVIVDAATKDSVLAALFNGTQGAVAFLAEALRFLLRLLISDAYSGREWLALTMLRLLGDLRQEAVTLNSLCVFGLSAEDAISMLVDGILVVRALCKFQAMSLPSTVLPLLLALERVWNDPELVERPVARACDRLASLITALAHSGAASSEDGRQALSSCTRLLSAALDAHSTDAVWVAVVKHSFFDTFIFLAETGQVAAILPQLGDMIIGIATASWMPAVLHALHGADGSLRSRHAALNGLVNMEFMGRNRLQTLIACVEALEVQVALTEVTRPSWKMCESALCGEMKCKHSMRRCGGCSNAYYCNGDCQRRDWKRHKIVCYNLRLSRLLTFEHGADKASRNLVLRMIHFYLTRNWQVVRELRDVFLATHPGRHPVLVYHFDALPYTVKFVDAAACTIQGRFTGWEVGKNPADYIDLQSGKVALELAVVKPGRGLVSWLVLRKSPNVMNDVWWAADGPVCIHV
uniref:MYND-type domain-containing protein n=1 Tax=Mycena chlorophos TaxID=658473 RepID=A0ABQ0LBX3_MYCCL|nr:predicted protein [Mycena chlorophos]